MTICNFFLQGRCRYGDKCWNEHPRGGGGGGGNRGGGGGGGYNNRSTNQQQSRGGGGFANRVWVNPDHQKGSYIKASSFSSHGGDDWGQGGQGGADWGRGGGGNDWGRGGGGGGGRGRDNVKSYEFGYSSQNRFSALDTPTTFDRGGGRREGGKPGNEEDDKQVDIIQKDMEAWESSRQWCLSCYSNSLAPLSGFTDVSPEELRLEFYSTRASGDVQGYINGVNQLLNQWRSRIQELKVMNPATRTALLAELKNPVPQASSSGFGTMPATGFGSTTSDFGSKGFGSAAPVQASSFSFAATSGGFGAPSSSAGFGSATAAPAQPPSGFGSTSASSASTFSFAADTNKPAATSGFGSASGFSFSSSANTGGGFGSGFGSGAPAAAAAAAAAGGSSIFAQKSGGFGTPAAAAAAGSAGEALDSLFSPESNLTPEELSQFKAKRFTLGQIPLKPPPANMLII
ncbi:nucleoporin 2 [Solea senegalensis]|uniref:Nucleoporin NUP42 n=1 Tax=Solea senegalensis TaxID=28829 RepID=A0AAV6R845_SOLSE|nr:nucleoporin NUP42 [Solea senegalensis]KAG7500863.1 nucleoporin 2 [Solea senegalensis]